MADEGEADPEILENVDGKIRRSPLADADDAKLRTPHDADVQRRNFPFERDGSNEAGAARTEDVDDFDPETTDGSRARPGGVSSIGFWRIDAMRREA